MVTDVPPIGGRQLSALEARTSVDADDDEVVGYWFLGGRAYVGYPTDKYFANY